MLVDNTVLGDQLNTKVDQKIASQMLVDCRGVTAPALELFVRGVLLPLFI